MRRPVHRAVPRRRCLLCMLLLLWAGPACAQTIATTFDELRLKVKAGDVVYVTDDTGREAEVTVIEVSGSSLAVSIAGARHDLTEPQVKRVRQRQSDSLVNGALIGAGASLAFVGIVSAASGSGEHYEGNRAAAMALAAGAGVGIGLAIDAGIKGRKTIFAATDAHRPAGVILVPVVSRNEMGLVVSIRY